jgi:hypothetical protein
MTALLASLFKLFVWHEAGALHWARSAIDTFAIQSSFVGPLIHRIVLVGG